MTKQPSERVTNPTTNMKLLKSTSSKDAELGLMHPVTSANEHLHVNNVSYMEDQFQLGTAVRRAAAADHDLIAETITALQSVPADCAQETLLELLEAYNGHTQRAAGLRSYEHTLTQRHAGYCRAHQVYSRALLVGTATSLITYLRTGSTNSTKDTDEDRLKNAENMRRLTGFACLLHPSVRQVLPHFLEELGCEPVPQNELPLTWLELLDMLRELCSCHWRM